MPALRRHDLGAPPISVPYVWLSEQASPAFTASFNTIKINPVVKKLTAVSSIEITPRWRKSFSKSATQLRVLGAGCCGV